MHDGNLLSWSGWIPAHKKWWINSLVLLYLWVPFALPIELSLAQTIHFLTFTFMILSLHPSGQVTEWLCAPGVKYWHKLMAYSNPTPQIQRGLKCSYFYTYSSDIFVLCVYALVIRIAFWNTVLDVLDTDVSLHHGNWLGLLIPHDRDGLAEVILNLISLTVSRAHKSKSLS